MLALENRDDLRELPTDSDFYGVLSALKEENTVGYWHDTGHSMVKESLGVSSQMAQLERMDPFLLGFHLKDALKDGTENLPMGAGELDWAGIAKHIRGEHVLTVELSPSVTMEEMIASREYVEDLISDMD